MRLKGVNFIAITLQVLVILLFPHPALSLGPHQPPMDFVGSQVSSKETPWPMCINPGLGAAETSEPLTMYRSVGVPQADAELLFAGSEAALYLWDTGEILLVSKDHLQTAKEAAVFYGREELFEGGAVANVREEGAISLDGFLERIKQDFPGLPQNPHGPFVLKVPILSSIPPPPPSDLISSVAKPEGAVLTEGFEASPWARWQRGDNTSGAFTWEVSTCDAHSGAFSADAIRGGSSGSLLACDDYYPSGVDTWFTDTQCENVYGASQAWLDFFFASDTENSWENDYFAVWFVPGVSRGGWAYSGSYSGWWHSINNMRQWPAKGDLTLNRCNYLQVSFHSEGYFASGFGARLDDIKVLTGPADGRSCSISASPINGPAPLTVSFSALVTGATGEETYQWKFDDGGTSSLPNPSYTFSSPGTYLVQLVVSFGQSDWEVSSLKITVANPSLPNDVCDDAIIVSAIPFSHSQNTTHASSEPSDPTPSCGYGYKNNSVWYRFTPSTTSFYLADTSGSDYGTILSVYTGSCGGFAPVSGACNFDSSANHSSRVLFPANAGATYYFMVCAYWGGGNLVFNLTQQDININDGGFENGPPPASGWSEYVPSGETRIITPETYVWNMDAYEGQYVWWGGGYDWWEPTSNYVQQSVLVPPGGTVSLFAYFLRKSDDDNDGDNFTVSVNGTSIFRKDLTKANNASQWEQIGPLSLIDFAGQIVTLRFSVDSFGSSTGNALVDHVVIEGSSCNAPNISTQPKSQYLSSGRIATLSVIANGDGPLHYHWYQGPVGSTNNPVGSDSPTFETPALLATTSYWVRVSNSCAIENSQSATVTVISHDIVVLKSIAYTGASWVPWKNDTVRIFRVKGISWSKFLDLDESGTTVWNLDLKADGNGSNYDAKPGEIYSLSYSSSWDYSWGLGMILYPKSQDSSEAEVFQIEHAWYPDWPTNKGYPFFTVTRFPKNGKVDPTKQAIVFLHGVGGNQGYWNDGEGLPEALAAKGYEVWELSYPPEERVKKSAWAVYRALERIQSLRGGKEGPKGKLDIVAHSMGGMIVRAILQDMAESKHVPKGSLAAEDLIDRAVFLESPMHGSHAINGMWGESSGDLECWGKYTAAALYQEYKTPARFDLALGSQLTWDLNSLSALQHLHSTYPNRLLSIVGTSDDLGYGNLTGSCDESESDATSADDGCVNVASGVLNQTVAGVSFTGFPAAEIQASHLLPGAASTTQAVQTVTGKLDSFFNGTFSAGGTPSQKEGIPLFRVTKSDGSRFTGAIKFHKYCARTTDGQQLYRNESDWFPLCPDNQPNPYGIFYYWDAQDRQDMEARAGYCLDYLNQRGWFQNDSWDRFTSFDVPEGVTSFFDVAVPQSARDSDSHFLMFIAASQAGGPIARLDITDPQGKVISPVRNDFTDGSAYKEADYTGDGLADSLVGFLNPLQGAYRVRWSADPSAAPTARFHIIAYLDGEALGVLPDSLVYQQGSGDVAVQIFFDAPASVQDLQAQRGVLDGQVVLTWTDPPGAGFRYDLRFGTSSLSSPGAWDAASHLGTSDSPTSTTHRYVLQMPIPNQIYYFQMKVIGSNGKTSSQSNETMATSGPGGTPSGDTTPPSRPVVTDEGDTSSLSGHLTFSWFSSDAESGIRRYRYTVGTQPNGREVLDWTDAGTATSALVQNSAIVGSQTYYCTVVATNGDGLESLPGISDGITVQDTCSGDSFEPDNSPETAKPIALGVPQAHNLCSDLDYLLFAVRAGMTYQVKTYNLEPLCRPHLLLLDGTTYAPIAEAGYGTVDSSSPFSPTLTWTATSTGSMLIAITSGDGIYGAYRGYQLVLTIPGDCDGDGQVSIGEVQKAINMFLGILAPDCGADINGDASVSIGEIQKVINTFLG